MAAPTETATLRASSRAAAAKGSSLCDSATSFGAAWGDGCASGCAEDCDDDCAGNGGTDCAGDCDAGKMGNENAKSESSAKIRRKDRIELHHESVTWRNDSTAHFCVRQIALAMCRFKRRPRTEKPLAGGLAAAAAARPPTGGFASSYPTAPTVKPAGNFHGRPLD